LRRAVALLEPLTAEDAEAPRPRHDLATALNNLATLLRDTGRLADAERAAERAAALWKDVVARHPEFPAYPLAYAVGLYGLTQLRDRLHVDLPDEEAANIAFHVANAQRGSATFDALQAVKIIDAVVTIVRYSMGVQLLDDNLHFSRFISHIQYFVGRLLDDRMLSSEDDFLFTQIGTRYPEALISAEKVRQHILTEYGKYISNEEVAYLALHIQRLAAP